jgi:hypothetical protein
VGTRCSLMPSGIGIGTVPIEADRTEVDAGGQAGKDWLCERTEVGEEGACDTIESRRRAAPPAEYTGYALPESLDVSKGAPGILERVGEVAGVGREVLR